MDEQSVSTGAIAVLEELVGSRRVGVALGERSYDVIVGGGLMAKAAGLIHDTLGPGRCAIVTDANVAEHYLAPLQRTFSDAGKLAGDVIVAPGEGSKDFATLETVTTQLLQLGLERSDYVVALGGGVIGDLAGFGASILRRGIRFVQIPTTLLAQVDSSVGGKTGINTPEGKNLIGAFHQPRLVLADIDCLNSLSDRHMRAGYAEIVKYGLLGDAAFYAWLEVQGVQLLAREREAVIHGVAHSVEMKAEIVRRDETEQGDRALLNLGHTFGHALEAWAGYSDRLLHGEAVAIGMCQAARYSHRLGRCSADEVARIEAHLAAVGLPTRVADIAGSNCPNVDGIMALMAQDKKVQSGELTLILLDAIGKAVVCKAMDAAEIRAFVGDEIAA